MLLESNGLRLLDRALWGGNTGYSWGEAKRDFTVIGVGTASGSQDIDGVIGGFQTGYNFGTRRGRI